MRIRASISIALLCAVVATTSLCWAREYIPNPTWDDVLCGLSTIGFNVTLSKLIPGLGPTSALTALAAPWIVYPGVNIMLREINNVQLTTRVGPVNVPVFEYTSSASKLRRMLRKFQSILRRFRWR